MSQSKEFIKKFEDINNFETKITLKIRADDKSEKLDLASNLAATEEFIIKWDEIQFLCQDLSKIEAYDIPLIIFNFNLVKTHTQNNIFSRQEKGMYFTTDTIWNQLLNKNALPKSSWDPLEI